MNEPSDSSTHYRETSPTSSTTQQPPLPPPSSTTTTTTTVNNNNDDNNNKSYTGRKPKWWKTLAGRRGTKSQRAVISRMTVLGYVIPKLDRYRHLLKVPSELFGVPPRGTALTADRILSPPDNDGDGTTKVDESEVQRQRPYGTTITTMATTGNSTTDNNTSLEIGFGSGDNLLTNAMNHPSRDFIGAEIHQPGVGIALGRMEKAVITSSQGEGNDNDGGRQYYWDEQTWWRQPQQQQQPDDDDPTASLHDGNESAPSSSSPPPLPPSNRMPYDNVRIYPGDGIKLLQFLPPSSLDSIYLTHPDPWPNPGQTHWRVIQEETVREMERVLKSGGCFYLATDAVCFDGWTKEVFGILSVNKNKAVGEVDGRVGGWEEVLPCPDRRGWLPVVSKYEEKGIDEGRETMVQCWSL